MQVDPDGQLPFLIPIAINIAIGCAIDYALPAVVAGIEYYSGSVAVATFASGALKAYNDDYLGTLSGSGSWTEMGGAALGTIASLSPSKLSQKALKHIASGEAASIAINKTASLWQKGAARLMAGKTARASAQKVATTSSQKAAELAAAKGVVQASKKVGQNVATKKVAKRLMSSLKNCLKKIRSDFFGCRRTQIELNLEKLVRSVCASRRKKRPNLFEEFIRLDTRFKP